jgi:hypothetical protein
LTLQITRTLPSRRMILQASQMRLTLGRTFMMLLLVGYGVRPYGPSGRDLFGRSVKTGVFVLGDVAQRQDLRTLVRDRDRMLEVRR